MNWSELIDKKIFAFRGGTYKGKTPLEFILFNDEETYIELREQDIYDYHDCNNSARTMHLWKDAAVWSGMFNKEGFDEPNNLGAFPF